MAGMKLGPYMGKLKRFLTYVGDINADIVSVEIADQYKYVERQNIKILI